MLVDSLWAMSALVFKRARKYGHCDLEHDSSKSGIWDTWWASWPVGTLCDDCRNEWTRIEKEILDEATTDTTVPTDQA